VLEALANALQLDDAERAHLHDLARAVNPVAPKRRHTVQGVQQIVDAMATPPIVRNSRVDCVSANRLGRALYAPVFDSREQPANSARFTFLDPAAHDFSERPPRRGCAGDEVLHARPTTPAKSSTPSGRPGTATCSASAPSSHRTPCWSAASSSTCCRPPSGTV
jgi:hypothetical protein